METAALRPTREGASWAGTIGASWKGTGLSLALQRQAPTSDVLNRSAASALESLQTLLKRIGREDLAPVLVFDDTDRWLASPGTPRREAARVAPAVASTAPDFESEVLPVLKSRCFACHGPLRQRGNLRLDSRPAMLIGGGRGAAIVPGNKEASLLVSAIRREDELEMPPPRPLDAGERELLEAWIAAGAEWPLARQEEAGPVQVAVREVPPVEHGIAGLGEPLSFNRDVRPILADHCYACHGPDEAVRQAGLRLDNGESALGVLPSGRRALVPGDLDKSQLFQRIAAVDALDRMPPSHADSTLSDREIEVLGRFVLQGAEFEDHWGPPRIRAAPGCGSCCARSRATPRRRSGVSG